MNDPAVSDDCKPAAAQSLTLFLEVLDTVYRRQLDVDGNHGTHLLFWTIPEFEGNRSGQLCCLPYVFSLDTIQTAFEACY